MVRRSRADPKRVRQRPPAADLRRTKAGARRPARVLRVGRMVMCGRVSRCWVGTTVFGLSSSRWAAGPVRGAVRPAGQGPTRPGAVRRRPGSSCGGTVPLRRPRLLRSVVVMGLGRSLFGLKVAGLVTHLPRCRRGVGMRGRRPRRRGWRGSRSVTVRAGRVSTALRVAVRASSRCMGSPGRATVPVRGTALTRRRLRWRLIWRRTGQTASRRRCATNAWRARRRCLSAGVGQVGSWVRRTLR